MKLKLVFSFMRMKQLQGNLYNSYKQKATAIARQKATTIANLQNYKVNKGEYTNFNTTTTITTL